MQPLVFYLVTIKHKQERDERQRLCGDETDGRRQKLLTGYMQHDAAIDRMSGAHESVALQRTRLDGRRCMARFDFSVVSRVVYALRTRMRQAHEGRCRAISSSQGLRTRELVRPWIFAYWHGKQEFPRFVLLSTCAVWWNFSSIVMRPYCRVVALAWWLLGPRKTTCTGGSNTLNSTACDADVQKKKSSPYRSESIIFLKRTIYIIGNCCQNERVLTHWRCNAHAVFSTSAKIRRCWCAQARVVGGLGCVQVGHLC